MAFNVTMPKWGLTMREGKITKWLKKEGDPVQKGEELFEVETEKITNVVEAPSSGVLFQIVAPAGATVPVARIVAIIAGPGEEPDRLEVFQMREEVEAPTPPAGVPARVQPEETQEKKFIIATPAARRRAKELGIDLALVPGSGPGGRIKEEDVTKFHEAGPPQPKATPLAVEMAKQAGLDLINITGTGEGGKITKEDVERVLETKVPKREREPTRSLRFTGMRRTIADNMYTSLQNTAQLTVFTEVDVTEMIRFRDLVREQHKDDETGNVSQTDIVILAASRALMRFPIMNSTLVGDEILLHDAVNIGIAVALDKGLIVPVLHDADRKELLQISRESRELIRKAREGTLAVDEVTGGTFTITTLGMFDMDGFTPILRPPETGILGVGRVKEKPAVSQGVIAIRSMMYLSLTFDHRVVDGAPASQFLQMVARYLQCPALIMT